MCVCICKSLNHFPVLQKLTKLFFEDLFIYGCAGSFLLRVGLRQLWGAGATL